VQPMEFHAARTQLSKGAHSEALAKLTLEPPELHARLGLTFEEAESALGPVWFAFGQLSDGTILGFNRLIDDPHPGTEVAQYTRRRAPEVLAELLYETGLSHDQVSWLAGPPFDEDERLWARSRAEADLYLRLEAAFQNQPEDPVEDATEAEVDGHPVVRHRNVEIYLLAPAGGATPPSRIIDPGGWMRIALQFAGAAQYRQAAEAVIEALRFVTPGKEDVPVRMFWTPVGLETLRQYPHLFNRGALEAKLAEYEAAAEQSSDSPS
jgi:hypothetical protein